MSDIESRITSLENSVSYLQKVGRHTSIDYCPNCEHITLMLSVHFDESYNNGFYIDESSNSKLCLVCGNKFKSGLVKYKE